MTTLTDDRIVGMLAEDVAAIRKRWGWLLALGIVQIGAGMLAVSFAFFATIASVAMLGTLLLIAAGAQTAAALWAREWRGFFLFMLAGVFYAVTGLLMLLYPIAAAEALTLMLGAAFLVGGTFRIIVAAHERFPSWGWVLCNGILTVFLGFAICQQWPASGLWVLGLFVGIELIVSGVTWTVLATGVRRGLAQLIGH